MLTLLGAGQGQNFAPSLSFDWLNTNSLTSSEGYPLTFTRASQATYWGSDGLLKTASTNEARFEYEPNTLVKRGLKIEPQATNLLRYSNDLSQTDWVKTSSTIIQNTSETNSPDGLQNAIKITNSGSGDSIFQSISSFAIGEKICQSFFIKRGTLDWVRLAISDNINGATDIVRYWINLSSKTKGSYTQIGTATFDSFDITLLPNDWVKVNISARLNGTHTSARFYVFTSDADLSTNRASLGRIYYRFGHQAEISYFSSYIQTTTATVTRSADMVTMSIGAWYNSAQGSILAQYMSNYLATTDIATVMSMNDGTANNRMLLRSNNGSGSQQMLVTSGGTEQANITAIGIATLTPYKTALGYNANDFAIVSNNGSIATDTSGTAPSINMLRLGSNVGTTESVNGWLRSFKYYPTKLSNLTLQALTV